MRIHTSLALAALSMATSVMAADRLPLRLVDANGAVLGRLPTSLTTAPLGVYRDTGQGTLTFIQLQPAQHEKVALFALLRGPILYFATTDCSGPAWFNAPAAPGALPSFVSEAGTGTRLYVADGYEQDPGVPLESAFLRGRCRRDPLITNTQYKASAPPIDLGSFVGPFGAE